MTGLKLHEVYFKDAFVPQLVRMFPSIEVMYIWQGQPDEDDAPTDTDTDSEGEGEGGAAGAAAGAHRGRRMAPHSEAGAAGAKAPSTSGGARAAYSPEEEEEEGEGHGGDDGYLKRVGRLSWITDRGLHAFAGLKRITYSEVRAVVCEPPPTGRGGGRMEMYATWQSAMGDKQHGCCTSHAMPALHCMSSTMAHRHGMS